MILYIWVIEMRITFKHIKLLQGGFAKCYEIQDMASNRVYAGKIVSKKLMVKSSQKEKMAQEISIHRSLQHKHVVGFHSFFEDSLNIYIILELCKRRVSVVTRSIITNIYDTKSCILIIKIRSKFIFLQFLWLVLCIIF